MVIIVFLFLTFVSMSLSLFGCTSVEDEVLVTTTQAEENDEMETYVENILLTDEEAEQNHLMVRLSEKVLIDAYITPRSYYEGGIGKWEATSLVEGATEQIFSYNELQEQDLMLGLCSFGEFVELMDQMTETLGDTWRSEWESLKTESTALGSKSYFLYNGYIDLATAGYASADSQTLEWVEGEAVEQDYLSIETYVQAVIGMLTEIYPNLEARYDLKNFSLGTEDETEVGYSLWFYEAIEQIGIRPAFVSNHIQAGKMAEDSYDYKELYETRDYGFGNTAGYFLAKIYVTEGGISGEFACGNTYELYEERADVVDINDILAKVVSWSRSQAVDITVSEIMLTMAQTPVQEEDGKYRIIYAPYWVVSYSYEQNGTEIQSQIVYDAYSGETVYP